MASTNLLNNLTDADFDKISQYEKQYKLLRKIKDPRFGDCNILKNPINNDLIVSKEKNSTSKDEVA